MFLRPAVAFWVFIGIPASFLGALMLLPVGGNVTHQYLLSLLGFIIVLGIVVDDAIVTGENIYTRLREGAKSRSPPPSSGHQTGGGAGDFRHPDDHCGLQPPGLCRRADGRFHRRNTGRRHSMPVVFPDRVETGVAGAPENYKGARMTGRRSSGFSRLSTALSPTGFEQLYS